MRLLLLFATACKTATPEPTDTDPQPTDCTQVELDACASTDGCREMLGRPMYGDPPCFDLDDTPVALACVDEELACPAVEVVATDPDGQPWYLPGGCAPEGWPTTTDPVEECQPEPACDTLDTEACTQTTGCMVIAGQPLPDGPDGTECYDPYAAYEPIVCSIDMDCDQAITYANQGADTPIYRFDSCTPSGWTAVPDTFAECPCTSLDADACTTESACMPVEGIPLDMSGPCVDTTIPHAFQACIPDAACGQAITYAAAPDATLHQFPDTCIPPGWTLAAATDYPTCP